MKLRLACACSLLAISPYSPYLFAQSIPVGQITRQITTDKNQSQAVDTFQNKLDEVLQSSEAVTGELASKMVDSVGSGGWPILSESRRPRLPHPSRAVCGRVG